MKNKKYICKFISLLMSIILTFGIIPLNCFASEIYENVDIITFGSYPQSKVTNSNLIKNLEKLTLNWKSYNYYSGTDIYDDGNMTSSDYMRYADVYFGGDKYRAVTFDTYRPTFTGYKSTENAENYQDNNGYYRNNVYWFKYEPLQWRVIDEETGYVVCESIIDSQAFSNYLYFNGSAFYMDNKSYDYSNYYVNSSIRNWLNTEFLNTAFTDEEKEQITINYMDDFYKDIEDKIFLPSANEMKNTNHWKNDTCKIAYGTDYARCQGLFESDGKAYWRLRNAADWSEYICGVCTDGTMYGYNYYYRCYPYQTSFTGTGVRPAIKLGNLSNKTFEIKNTHIEISEAENENKMSIFNKIFSLWGGINSIIKYNSTEFTANDKTNSVISSLGKGINIPCMEDGWAREWALEKFTYSNIKSKGFDYIRLPANLVCMLDSNGKLNESAANNLDRVIKYAVDAKLSVILDLHGWQDLNNDPSTENIETIVSVWKQIAERYKDYPAGLMFQIYNEPNNNSGYMSNIRWNYIQNKVTAAIREIDEDRIIVLSPMNYNVSSSLKKLFYNHNDKNIIIDVHNYSPMEFTHQGAEWIDGYDEKTSYTEEAKESFADAIKTAVEYRERYGTKIIIGEFGAYQKIADKEDITSFLKDAVTVMNENNLPWAYWEYYAGFGAYDSETKEWKTFVTDGLFCN